MTPGELSKKIENLHDGVVAAGFEGIMVRNAYSPYHLKSRPKDLLKCKIFDDNEFKIVGGKPEVGKDAGCVVFECEVEPGKVFSVRPKGNKAYRKKLYAELDDHIGKNLTVKYQGLTDNGIPRFPVGVAIRDYE
jgi:DNA ligase-1